MPAWTWMQYFGSSPIPSPNGKFSQITATGGQLHVNGEPIVGYLDTLTYKIQLWNIEGTDQGDYYTTGPGPNWFYYFTAQFPITPGSTGGQAIPLGPVVLMPAEVMTVSSAPFDYPRGASLTRWQCVGLLDPNIDPNEAQDPNSPNYLPDFRYKGFFYLVPA
jgi:hypothetical protein